MNGGMRASEGGFVVVGSIAWDEVIRLDEPLRAGSHNAGRAAEGSSAATSPSRNAGPVAPLRVGVPRAVATSRSSLARALSPGFGKPVADLIDVPLV